MRLIGAGTQDGFDYTVTDRFWTIPNIITVVRFLLVPVFVYLTAFAADYWPATIVLIVLFSTDWIDGYIARRFNMISTVGMWLDPLADRLSLLIVSATLVLTGIAPMWLVWAILIPDVVLALNSWLLFRGSPDLPVTVIGKVRTALLMIAVPFLMVALVAGPHQLTVTLVATLLLAVACILHWVASIDYFFKARAKHRAQAMAAAPSAASTPSPTQGEQS
ncbi:cardiolipin synthase [Neomicrococcus aestuarii]|uniref:Cardiolipin synthase n=1 Tax=Neomicrococcus aestuarii TaxID=556325 RepID=A0A7W8X0B8_9MICC|nr:CDP-alcohol phosphatidyltransferase family protein [Neomicrococcus aestuarii]MBB5511549.1 cardiolipin synthase [Neomicrococcus aestuarii]